MCSGAAPSAAGSSFRNEGTDIPIVFSKEALIKGLRAIYNKKIDTHNEIERYIFEETLRLFDKAAGLDVGAEMDTTTERILEEIRNNNYVFSAFKTHRMQNDIAAQLIDAKTGQLKSFERWMRDVKGITDHYCKSWLETEYNTAVIRAHQAADWKHFLEEQDVFPNVRWMPTTSVTPDPLHQHYWEKKLTLPVNHPFWQEHRPGDRWNCKCTLQQTDEPVNAEALDGYTPPLPMPGLDNNPANDGKLFSDTHPYYTEAYPGATDATKRAIFEAKTVEEAKSFILENIADECDFPFKKSELSSINAALNQLKERMDFYGIPKFKKLTVPRQGIAAAAYNPYDHTLSLKPSLFSTRFAVSEYEKEQKFFKKYGYHYSTGGSPGDLVRSIIDHELGHAVNHRNVIINSDVLNAFEKDRHPISWYASVNKEEFFAECIAAYWGPEREEMTDIEIKLIEKVFNMLGFSYY